MLKIYHELCALNTLVPDTEESFLEFADKMTYIAEQLPKVLIEGVLTNIVPRADQLATMCLLHNSTKQLTLLERGTGTGKSVELALLAHYFFHAGNKVLVLVPSGVLKLD